MVTSQQIVSGANAAIEKQNDFDFGKFEAEYINTNAKLFKIKKVKSVVQQQECSKGHFDYTPFLRRFSKFREDHSKPKSISVTFLSYIKKLLQQGRIGSAVNYQRTFISIKAFNGNVLFSDITVSFLFQFENWMLSRGRPRPQSALC